MKLGSYAWWKDRLLLLLVAFLCAGLASAFARMSGKNAPTIILAITVFALLIDNRRLRKALRQVTDENRRREP
ncbi:MULTISPECIES: hypothetical protein [Burkholderia]|uniref:Uncharacterized protein n=1 Tax=Burkholderia semiarida TaxID=2843303 RepID=A0ABW7LDL1_9BURK|nr:MULTISPECIES: hypothetical protein [Burkholderia]MCA8032309.1 hypothetical protein [Burkholderia arboris]MCA8241976.1 hypothetical protein [Burkholderia sp. AU32262]MDF3088902.1 hypothetical protein [Burkholderia semiarida]MDF3102258.1 hypothetical protein [Burkholderia semiarida]MDN7698720.1 hypothetical protein [Burkholderia sp. AU44665]